MQCLVGGRVGVAAMPTGVVVLLAALSAGCQSYERKPLELGAHRAGFLVRAPEGPEVQKFAAMLDQAMGAANSKEQAQERFDVQDGVTIAEAEALALVFNSDLRVARLRAGVTKASVEHAGRWEDPTLGIDLARIVESTPHPWKAFGSLAVTIPISGRLGIEKQRAGIEHQAELARIAEREWTTRMELRREWTQWSALDAQVATMRDFIARMDQILSVVDKMEDAGEMARTEARLFRIQKGNAIAELKRVEGRTEESALRLKQLMGISPDANPRLIAQGIGTAHAMENPGDTRELETRNPAMMVAATEYEVAEKSLELEIRKQYPDLTIGPGIGREDGQDQVLLGLNLPLPIWNGNRGGIADARAKRDVARASSHAALEHVIAAERAAQARLESARQQREQFETEIVPLVDAQYTDARQLAQLGEVHTLVLLESLARQQEAKVRLIEARRDEELARIDVRALWGPAVKPGTVER